MQTDAVTLPGAFHSKLTDDSFKICSSLSYDIEGGVLKDILFCFLEEGNSFWERGESCQCRGGDKIRSVTHPEGSAEWRGGLWKEDGRKFLGL